MNYVRSVTGFPEYKVYIYISSTTWYLVLLLQYPFFLVSLLFLMVL